MEVYRKTAEEEEIIRQTGIIGMVRNGEKWIILKEGKGNWGLGHILRKHYKDFEINFGIKNRKELVEIILNSVKNADNRMIKKDIIIYYCQISEESGIVTVVDKTNNSIITSYIV